jgi:hypothetical protein
VSIESKNFEFGGGLKKTSIALMLIGVIAILASFSLNKTIAWVDFLVNNVYFVTVAVSGVFFLSVTGVLQASWLAPYKRIPEAMTKFLPYGFVLMLVTYFGLHDLYEWTHTDVVMNDPILIQKIAWLNTAGFMSRMVIIFMVWIFIGKRLLSLSKKQDEGEDVADKLVATSAIGLVLFAFAICLASFDWLMSVEPHWFSTIYGIGVFAGSFVSGITFICLITIKLREMGYLEGVVNDNHFHDMGKWMFGFSVFWAYIWFSQFMLIWYANIPEETEYYVLRMDHWGFVFWANFALSFVIPFFGLMTRAAKRSTKRLKIIGAVILLGHFVDLYLMVAPKIFEVNGIHDLKSSGYGALQFLSWLGYLGLFIFVVGTALSKNKLVSNGDPQLEEGIALHQ